MEEAKGSRWERRDRKAVPNTNFTITRMPGEGEVSTGSDTPTLSEVDSLRRFGCKFSD